MVRLSSDDVMESTFQLLPSDDWGEYSELDSDQQDRDSDPEVQAKEDGIVGKCLSLFERSHSWQNGTSSSNDIVDFEKCLFRDKLWIAISENYASPAVFSWQDSKMKSLSMPVQCENVVIDEIKEEEEDDVDLFRDMDMHLLTTRKFSDSYSESHDDVIVESDKYVEIQTADEVIEEIEEIWDIADKQDEAFDEQLQDQTGIVLDFDDEHLDTTNTPSSGDVTIAYPAISILDEADNERSKALKRMTTVQLNEELIDLEAKVRILSESLLAELNLRDELLFEKEVRNTFITKLLEVQYKQEQFQQNTKIEYHRFRFGKLKKSLSMSNASEMSAPGRFLTTVIPIDGSGVPSMENLQALIKLLEAIKEDSHEVPSLITNYILKVLCPAPSASSSLSL